MNVPKNQDNIQINLKDIIDRFINIITNYWFPMLLGLFSTIMIALIICMHLYIPTYERENTFTVNVVGVASDQEMVATQLLENNFSELQEGILNSKIRENLSLKKNEKFKLVIETIENVNMQKVSVISQDPFLTQQVSQELETLYPEYGSTSLNNLQIKKVNTQQPVSLVSDAGRLQIALVIGLGVGLFFNLVFIIERFFRHKVIQSTTTMKTITSLRNYSSLPRLLKPNVKNKKSLIRKSGYEQGITSIALKLQLQNKEVTMLVSSKVGEGVTTVTTKLANYFASEGKSVLVLHLTDTQTNMKINQLLRGKQSIDNSMESLNGVAELSININEFEQASYINEDIQGENEFSKLIDRLKLKFDLVFIDGLALEKANYLPPVAKTIDKLLYVVRQGESEIRELQNGLEYLEDNNFSIDGYILNAVNDEVIEYGISGKLNRYHNYYHYPVD